MKLSFTAQIDALVVSGISLCRWSPFVLCSFPSKVCLNFLLSIFFPVFALCWVFFLSGLSMLVFFLELASSMAEFSHYCLFCDSNLVIGKCLRLTCTHWQEVMKSVRMFLSVINAMHVAVEGL